MGSFQPEDFELNYFAAYPGGKTLPPSSELREMAVKDLLADNSLDGDGSMADQVYRLFHGFIVNLYLVPNQFLSEKEVAAVLNISKTPVREAFIRLAEEGLLTTIPKRGTYVTPIDIYRAFEGFFIRISLESACAERLIEMGDRADLSALSDVLDRQRQHIRHRDYDSFYILDNQFHSAMFVAAGLPHAKRLVESAKSEVDRIKALKSLYRVCRAEEELYDEHISIYQAIISGDADRAVREIRNHLTGINEQIQEIPKSERLWRLFNTVNNYAKPVRIPATAQG